MSFADKVCVITGASSGIGQRLALDLAQRGARVCAVARREDRLLALVELMGGSSKGHSYVRCDVSDKEQVRSLGEHVRAVYERCDVLVNNAGFPIDSPLGHPRAVEAVERVVATNLFGCVYCTAELLELLERSAPSSVVNVASIVGRIAVPGSGPYSASKFALVGWSEAVEGELRARGVYLSLVEPGFIPTEGFPQTDFLRHPLLKHMLGTTSGVSAAILDAIEHRKPQRVVPRWYYLVQLPRVLVPPLHRAVARRVAAARRRGKTAPAAQGERQSKARSDGSPRE